MSPSPTNSPPIKQSEYLSKTIGGKKPALPEGPKIRGGALPATAMFSGIDGSKGRTIAIPLSNQDSWMGVLDTSTSGSGGGTWHCPKCDLDYPGGAVTADIHYRLCQGVEAEPVEISNAKPNQEFPILSLEFQKESGLGVVGEVSPAVARTMLGVEPFTTHLENLEAGRTLTHTATFTVHSISRI